MDAVQTTALRELLADQTVASLATLHRGRPAVSMVPLAWLPGQGRLVIHVSALATHAADMLATPEVAVLVTATPSPGIPVHALPRVSLQGTARPCPGRVFRSCGGPGRLPGPLSGRRAAVRLQ